MTKIIIAIDGYSSCGKSSTAKSVASKLNYAYVDSGAMYRAVTLYFINNHVTISNPHEVETALKNIHIEFKINDEGVNNTFLNGLNVEDEIRKLYVAERVSDISAIKEVRIAMVDLQRKMAKKKGLVMDGRDIGTVVFPNADLKIFMTADPKVRAQRRQLELLNKGEMVDLIEIEENIVKRDLTDTTRSESPLIRAADAIEIDNTYLTLEELVDKICLKADIISSSKLQMNDRS